MRSKESHCELCSLSSFSGDATPFVLRTFPPAGEFPFTRGTRRLAMKYCDAYMRLTLKCPVAVFKNLHALAVLRNTNDGHIARANHKIHVDHTIVDAARFALFIRQFFKTL